MLQLRTWYFHHTPGPVGAEEINIIQINSLPQDVVSAPSTDAFKARLDKHWESVDWLYDYQADTDK